MSSVHMPASCSGSCEFHAPTKRSHQEATVSGLSSIGATDFASMSSSSFALSRHPMGLDPGAQLDHRRLLQIPGSLSHPAAAAGWSATELMRRRRDQGKSSPPAYHPRFDATVAVTA